MARVQAGQYRQIFKNRAFALFWSGFTISVVGDAMTRVALTWYVYEVTGSARALGWLTLAYTGPVIVGGLLAGWLLDRYERRTVMLVDNVLRGLAVAIVPILYALGRLEVWIVYVVAAVYGSLMMISLAGGPSLLPSLVDKERLDTANALETLGFTVSGVVGPPLAGLFIARIGAPNVVLLDALSYFVFALALWRIGRLGEWRAPPSSVQPGADASSSDGASLRDAARLLRLNPILSSTTLMFMAFNLGLGFLTVWLPVYADRVAGGGAQLYGSLLGALAVGEVLSSVVAGSLVFSLALGARIALSQLLAGLGLGVILLGSSAWWAAVALFLLGLFSAPLTIWAQTLRMAIIPDSLRGRTFALLRTMMQGATPLGGAAAGLLLPVVGMAPMMAASVLVIGLPGLIGFRVGALRRAGDQQIHPAERFSPGQD